jgi:hypothetical protein
MQSCVVENGTKTALLAQLTHRRDNGGLVEIVGEDVDRGGCVLFAIGDEVEQLLAGVSTEPGILRLEGLVSKLRVFGPLGRISAFLNLSA